MKRKVDAKGVGKLTWLPKVWLSLFHSSRTNISKIYDAIGPQFALKSSQTPVDWSLSLSLFKCQSRPFPRPAPDEWTNEFETEKD